MYFSKQPFLKAVTVISVLAAATFTMPTIVQGMPAVQTEHAVSDLRSEVIQTAIRTAAQLFQQLENEFFCTYLNLTVSELISEGKLLIPEIELDTDDIFIFMSVADTPASFSDLLSPHDQLDEDGPTSISLDRQLLESLLLETVTYNCESNSLTVTSRPYGTQTIIPEVMELRNMRFILSTGIQQETLVEFSGNWTIGSFSLNIDLDLSFENDNVMVSGDISSDFDFKQLIQEITGTQLPPVVSGVFQHVRVEADSSTGVAVLSTQFGTNNKVYLIIEAQPDDESTSGFQTSGAVAVETSSIQFSSLVQQLFSQDIANIPYFNSLTLPAVSFIIAEDTIISDSISRAFMECPLLSNNGGEIQEGTTIFLQPGFTTSVLQLMNTENILAFNVFGIRLSLRNLISSLPGVNLQSIILPPGVSNILDLTINGFEIDVNLRVLTVEIALPLILTYCDDIFSIMDTTAFITVDFMDNTLTVAVNGDLTIAGVSLDVTIFPDDMGEYVLQASTEQLHITDIVQTFGADFLPPGLAQISSTIPFLNFIIEDPQMTFPLTSSPPQIHISGHPVISGYSIGPTTIIIIKENNQIYLVQAFELQSVNLADLLGTISPVSSTILHGLVFLDQDINTLILISPESLPDVTLSVGDFQDCAIKRGFSLKATITIPSTCSSDPFCAVFQFLLGEGYTFTLQGTIVTSSFYSLIARIEDIPITSGLTITDAGVEVRVQAGVVTDIGITGSIALSNPELTFTCRVAVRQPTTQVILEMTMSGCWEDPFGIPNIAICNLLSSISIQPAAPPVPTGLAFGGELRIGDEECRVITAQAYVGLHIVALENYYYANVEGEVTIPSLLEVFCITGVNLPTPLASAGFPNGFIVSFAYIERVLPHVPLTIRQGLLFNGTVNILGLRAHAELQVGLPNGFSMRVDLPRINIGGLLVMSASRSDQSKGPTLQTEIGLLPQPSVNMQANGYFSVLGISLETNMTITNDEYRFDIEGRVLNLFQATLSVSAPYGALIRSPFRVRGSFRNDLYSAIEDLINDVLQRVGNEADQIVDGLQRELNNARRVFDEADRALRSAQQEFDRAHGAFDDAVDEVNRLRNRVDRVCRIRNCGSVCVGCIRGTRCCGRRWGVCYCVEPRFDGCCSRITDPVCEAENAACYLLKEPIKALLATAREAVDGSRVVLDVAREALQVAREAARGAERTVDIANAALEAAQDTYQVGLQVASLITSIGTQLVSIKEISFDAALQDVNTGHFNGNLRGCLAGNDVSIGLSINLRDIREMAKYLADRVVSGVSDLF